MLRRAVDVFRTVATPAVLHALIDRLSSVRPDAPRRWGTLTSHEMLCHLGDACEMVTLVRPRARPLAVRQRPAAKYLWLWLPRRLPHGVPTNPMHDPRAGGTRPTDFDRDRQRVVAALRTIAAARPGSLEPAHGMFGSMTTRDWQRWAWRHTDYHLRQFGA
ncbi:MAG TPA: hypothetical protein VFT47_06885 [Vicinamibacterales bacterium]|nr:hypothetical protein [Vicinamibacterales bacterium]